MPGELHVVTGAFGYSGRYITQRLIGAGHSVRTLTNSPDRANPLGLGAVYASELGRRRDRRTAYAGAR
jgi:nucleoside-diphosphate-sugar epimerase